MAARGKQPAVADQLERECSRLEALLASVQHLDIDFPDKWCRYFHRLLHRWFHAVCCIPGALEALDLPRQRKTALLYCHKRWPHDSREHLFPGVEALRNSVLRGSRARLRLGNIRGIVGSARAVTDAIVRPAQALNDPCQDRVEPPSASPAEPDERGLAEPNGGRPHRPLRVWSHQYCPSCGLGGVKFISFSQFSRRSREGGGKGVHRNTVADRVKRGIYWASAVGKAPWCPTCRERTPEGEGVDEPPEKPHIDDWQPTDEQVREVTVWCAAVVREWFPNFAPEADSDAAADAPEADDAYHEAFKAVLLLIKREGRAVPRDHADDVARKAVQALLSNDYKSRQILSSGDISWHPAKD